MKNFRRQPVALHDLEIVRPAPPADDPPLVIGDRCRLNSGSPTLMVVDYAASDGVVVALPDGSEMSLPRACVRRRG